MIILINKPSDLKNINDNQELLTKSKITEELQVNPFGKYLLEVEDNQIIGYLYYSDIYDRAEINQIEVAISNRNCGKASSLLEKMIKLVDKNITLEVKKTNTPAIHLYHKYNFEDQAIRKGYYQGIDGILMERKVRK